SIRPEIAFAQAEQGIPPQRILSDCSGKHSGMLAACVAKGYPTQSYLDPAHPVQKEILALIAEVCAFPAGRIKRGVHGGTVPVFALPVYDRALGFARLANPGFLPAHLRARAQQVFGAMNAHPEMVSGSGGFCTALMKATGGRLIGK